MISPNSNKPKRTTVALTRDEYEVIDKARSHFNKQHGVNVSRTSFITSLATQYNKAHRTEET